MSLTALPAAISLTSVGILLDSTNLVAVDNTNGNSFPNDGKKLLVVNNGSGGSLTVTITSYPAGASGSKPDGLTVGNRTVTIATGKTVAIGPFKQGVYNDGSGLVEVAWSTGTSVIAGVFDATPNP